MVVHEYRMLTVIMGQYKMNYDGEREIKKYNAKYLPFPHTQWKAMNANL